MRFIYCQKSGTYLKHILDEPSITHTGHGFLTYRWIKLLKNKYDPSLDNSNKALTVLNIDHNFSEDNSTCICASVILRSQYYMYLCLCYFEITILHVFVSLLFWDHNSTCICVSVILRSQYYMYLCLCYFEITLLHVFVPLLFWDHTITCICASVILRSHYWNVWDIVILCIHCTKYEENNKCFKNCSTLNTYFTCI